MNRVQKREIAQRYSKTPALKLLHEMFHEISRTYYGYRESWEILIQVLGEHLGIIDRPWLYSDPNRDLEQRIDKLNPLRKPALWVERPNFALTMLAALLGIPLRQPTRIRQPTGPYHLPREIYYVHRYKTVWKQYPRLRSRLSTEAKLFMKKFEKQGLLQEYVKKARKESRWDSEFSIVAGPDHLGAIFEEFMLAGRKNRLGQMLAPINIVDFMIKIVGRSKPSDQIETVNDPATGTGRFLVEQSRLNPYVPMVLTGIEIDLTLYRAALVNMALYSLHPYSIICANALAIRPDANQIWEFGNLWDPPDMSQFYYKPPPPPQPFSLKGFVEVQQQQQTEVKKT